MALKLSQPNNKQDIKKQPISTVVIWYDAGVKFFVVEGDKSHLNQIFMGGRDTTEKQEEEIYALANETIKDGPNTKKIKRDMVRIFPTLAVLHGAKVIVTGYLP